MKERNILIFGASSGIGRATAEYMAERGDHVFLAARREERMLELKNRYPGVQGIWSVDLRDSGNVGKIFSDLRQEGIKLDGLVHCAGIAYTSPIRSFEEERFQEMCDINLKALLAALKFFASKQYSNEGGAVTVVSSVRAVKPEKGNCEYAATKGAVNALILSAAKELLKRKIRINAVSPGVVRTEIYEREKALFDFDAYIREYQPLGLIEPEEVAAVVGFLHSEAARLITGQNISIDAGSLLY